MKSRSCYFTLLAAFAALLALSVAALLPARHAGGAALMETSPDIAVTQNAAAPPELKLDAGRRGLALSTSSEGAEIAFAEELSGAFELTFRAYSDESFTDTAKWSQSNYVNLQLDLKKLAFRFTDSVTGESFTVVLDATSTDNITPMAYAEREHIRYGAVYPGDGAEESGTAESNYAGRYTRLTGTTFCNTARTEGEFSAERSRPVVIGFDPSSMRVYAYRYGAEAAAEECVTVAELSDGRIFGDAALRQGFERYRVTVCFAEIPAARTAKVLLYELNNQTLAEPRTNTAGPALYADFSLHAVSGLPYALPEAKGFDLLEGSGGYAYSVSVTDGSGNPAEVFSADGSKPVSDFEPGCYFLPEAEGEYEVTYIARDGAGLAGLPLRTVVRAFPQDLEADCVLAGDYAAYTRNTLGVGAELPLFPAEITAKLARFGQPLPAYVTLKREGEALEDVSRLAADTRRSVRLDAAGSYTVAYELKSGDSYLTAGEWEITVSDDVPAFLTEELPAVYAGERLLVPEAKAAFRGEEKTASAYLVHPAGSISEESYPLLADAGDYRLIYAVNFGGVTYRHTVPFSVKTHAGRLFTISDGSVRGGAEAPAFLPGRSGVLITGSRSAARATYNRVLNLSDSTANDLLIELMPVPARYGIADFASLTIQLTDAHDSSNFVRIVADYMWYNRNKVVYLRAGSALQAPTGMQGSAAETRKNTGTRIKCSFAGVNQAGCESIKLYYDDAEKRVYAANPVSGASRALVVDLDSPELFAESTLFGGFTNGEVVLSITANDIVGSSAGYMVLNVAGQDLTTAAVSDMLPPRISVDTQGYADLPAAVEGMRYPVFAASAYDSFEQAECAVSARAYYRYGKADQREIAITDGGFTPELPGSYAVVYTAKDRSGNVAVKPLELTALAEYPAVSFRFEEELPNRFVLGRQHNLERYSLTGGSGVLAVKFSCARDGAESDAITDGIFRPSQPGGYDVTVTVTDFLGRETSFSRFVEVVSSNLPVLSEQPVLQDAVLNRSAYVFPDFDAVYYDEAEGKLLPAERSITVSYNSFPATLGADRIYVPNVLDSGDTLKVRYSARVPGTDLETVYEKTVKVIDPYDDGRTLKMERLFFQKDILSANPDNRGVTYKTRAEGAYLSFINPVLDGAFEFKFAVPKSANRFRALKVTLMDAEDTRVALEFTVERGGANKATSVFRSGGETSEISSNFFGSTNLDFYVLYDRGRKALVDGNTLKTLAVPQITVAGAKFGGFPSGKVFFRAEFVGVEGDSAIQVRRVSNHTFSNVESDFIAPAIRVAEEISPAGAIGSPIRLPGALVSDVVSGNLARVTLTVLAPDKKMLLEGEDAASGFVFTPDRYGDYTAIYRGIDASGQFVTSTYTITVSSSVTPELAVRGELPASARVFEEIPLPIAEVTNLPAEDVSIRIYSISENDEMRRVEGGVFVPKKAGVYVIRYCAVDRFYHAAYVEYRITVS